MAIFQKSELRFDLEQLELRYQALKQALVGLEARPNIWDQYANDPDHYRSQFVEIDLGAVDYAIHDFQGALKRLGTLAKRQAPKRTPGKGR